MNDLERPTGLAGIVRGAVVKPLSFADLEGSGSMVSLPSSRGGDPKAARIRELEARIGALEADLSHLQRIHSHELSSAKENAYQQGLRDGTAAGEVAGKAMGKAIAQAEAERTMVDFETSVRKKLDLVEFQLEQVILDWDRRFLELSMGIARRIVGDACEVAGPAVQHVARMALRKLGAEMRLVVRCHPEDHEVLEREKELWGGRGGSRRVEIQSDETMTRGGVVIETDQGIIDARIPRLTENVERALAEAFEQEREGDATAL